MLICLYAYIYAIMLNLKWFTAFEMNFFFYIYTYLTTYYALYTNTSFSSYSASKHELNTKYLY